MERGQQFLQLKRYFPYCPFAPHSLRKKIFIFNTLSLIKLAY